MCINKKKETKEEIVDKNNVYYVYEWIRLDTKEPFYVGKGKGDRWCHMKRNDYFDRVVNKCDVVVSILHDNLDEETAFDYEWYYIDLYRNLGYELTNIADGGSGGIHLFGKDNPMYGRPWWDDNTPKEKITEWKKKVGHKGKDNPMYKISPRERMSVEVYNQWLENKRKSCLGENNPNYGNDTLKKKLEKNPELKIEYYSRKGSQNGRAKEVIMYDLDGNKIKTFSYIGECAKWLIDNNYSKGQIKSVSDNIKKASNLGKKFLKFKFKVN